VTRTAGDVGAGLAPARPARRIHRGERIHVVGIAGAGASAAALLAHAAGANVSGCDAGGESPYTAALHAAAIPIAWEHDPAHVAAGEAPTRLAVTKALTAIAPDHPELRAARDAGIPLEPWQQVVADAASGRRLVAVAGTHGKSSTSGWLLHVLVASGRDPSAFVGALLPASDSGGRAATARIGGGDVFLVEADEYAGNFDAYRPEVALLTSVEWDHPDVFADAGAVVDAFVGWLRGMAPAGTLVANLADPGVAAVLRDLASDHPARLIGYRLDDDGATSGNARSKAPAVPPFPPAPLTPGRERTIVAGRIVAVDADGTTLEIRGLLSSGEAASVRLTSAGRHNAANALGVAAAALALGISPADVCSGLASFTGIWRRLERKGEVAGVVVYDDYGHHPTAIRETIAAMRQREPGRRLWAVLEPLTFHRTTALLAELAAALAEADAVAIADIWAGRDPDTTIVSAEALAAAVRRLRPGLLVDASGSVEDTADWLADRVRGDDAVLVMGGGRSYVIGERLLATLRSRAS